MKKSVFFCAVLALALSACSNNPPQESSKQRAELVVAGAASHCGGKKKHCILLSVEDTAKPATIELLPYSVELRNPGHKIFWLLDDTDGYFFKDDSITFPDTNTTQTGDFFNCGAVSLSAYSCEAKNGNPGKRHTYKIKLYNNDGTTISLDPFIVNR